MTKFKAMSMQQLKERGMADAKIGLPIESFYHLPIERHTELRRGAYEMGWRAQMVIIREEQRNAVKLTRHDQKVAQVVQAQISAERQARFIDMRERVLALHDELMNMMEPVEKNDTTRADVLARRQLNRAAIMLLVAAHPDREQSREYLKRAIAEFRANDAKYAIT